MKQWIVFLRGINVGGRNIKMAELKDCLHKAGYSGVQTVLQTGNIILENNAKEDVLKRQLEKLLSDTFSYPARLLVLDSDELKAVVNEFPFADLTEEYHKYVVLTESESAEKIVAESPGLNKVEEGIAAGKSVVYWYVQKGKTLDSVFGKFLSKASSKYLTTNRNLNTLNKILAKLER